MNSILADTLRAFADELEKSKDFDKDLQKLIKREITAHWRILFNGNGYGDEWIKEAEKRGLQNYKTLPDAMEHYLDKKNIELFSRMNVYTEVEMKSHHDVKLEKYCQVLNIEASTMIRMVHKDIIPSSFKYLTVLADTEFKMQRIFSLCQAGLNLMDKLNKLVNSLSNETDILSSLHDKVESYNLEDKAMAYAKEILPQMDKVRKYADEIEPLLGEDYKPFPSYEDLLFSVQ